MGHAVCRHTEWGMQSAGVLSLADISLWKAVGHEVSRHTEWGMQSAGILNGACSQQAY